MRRPQTKELATVSDRLVENCPVHFSHCLHYDLADYAAVHVGKPHIPPAKSKRQSFVIQAKLVEYGGMNIVNIDWVLDGAHAHFVGGTVGCSTSNAATRHPDRVSTDVVIASV